MELCTYGVGYAGMQRSPQGARLHSWPRPLQDHATLTCVCLVASACLPACLPGCLPACCLLHTLQVEVRASSRRPRAQTGTDSAIGKIAAAHAQREAREKKKQQVRWPGRMHTRHLTCMSVCPSHSS
jgi:hypothetical protein